MGIHRGGPPETVLPDPPAELTAALAAALEEAIPTGAAPRSPRSSRARRGSSTAGPGSASSPATRSRGTPASGSATTVVSTSSAKPVGAGAATCAGSTRRTAGFLRSLDGLRSTAAAIGETDEELRCAEFLMQLDPTVPGRPAANLEWLE